MGGSGWQCGLVVWRLVGRILTLSTVLLSVSVGAPAEAACTGGPTIWHASLDVGSIRTCFRRADTGDTVVLASGNLTLRETLSTGRKSITIQGAGAGDTVITSGFSCTSGGNLLHLTLSGGSPRVTGISFLGNPACRNEPSAHAEGALVLVNGVSSSFRFDHNYVAATRSPAKGVWVQGGAITGVIDHNVFDSNAGMSLLFRNINELNGSQHGDASWALSGLRNSDAAYGSLYMFVEDNTFTQSGYIWGVDQDHGARVVYRRNRLVNGTSIANHGLDTGGRSDRSSRIMDVYQNTFSIGFFWDGLLSSRGGTGNWFDNVVTFEGAGGVNTFMDLTYYRANPAEDRAFWVVGKAGTRDAESLTCSGSTAVVTLTGPPQIGVCRDGTYIQVIGSTNGFDGTYIAYADGRHGTTDVNCSGNNTNIKAWFRTSGRCPAERATGRVQIRSPVDENSDGTGYKVMDGHGMGAGDLLSGDFFTPAWPNQILEPMYIWNNVQAGSVVTTIRNRTPAAIKNNVHYYLPNPGCTAPSTCGTIATGVGRGLLANRPATCTPGTAYWATDQGEWDATDGEGTPWEHDNGAAAPNGPDGQLYVCGENNTWSVGFIPYTYPHPLVTNAASQ